MKKGIHPEYHDITCCLRLRHHVQDAIRFKNDVMHRKSVPTAIRSLPANEAGG